MRAFPLRPARRGFTLVEVLIVVVILGILAATVLPQFTSSTDDAKEAALKQNLQQLRGQIDLYRFQHNGLLPGDLGTEVDLFDDLLVTTKANGSLGDGADRANGVPGDGPYGPYLLGQFPANPLNNLNTVSFSAVKAVDGATGWWYNQTTGEIRANLPAGEPYQADDGTNYNLF